MLRQREEQGEKKPTPPFPFLSLKELEQKIGGERMKSFYQDQKNLRYLLFHRAMIEPFILKNQAVPQASE